ncbi:MAG TPA: phosphoribosylaminoimidazolesuccinocarboxamide synthase [Candidatus Peribacterales bacterium]|nr:phosphoribosylaminoimidazolesuccinocarboxamide synthase [Candidatus Peribacterales bacterium]
MIEASLIHPFLTNTVEKTDFVGLGKRYQGKVRDVYTEGDRVILVSTDRQSAFDEDWCTIPLKGQALNQMSAWWFEKVKDVMPTHVVFVPDPNVTVAKRLNMVKVEVVVRAYLTGSTSTSAWVNYEKGVRNFCGNALPDDMKKNQKFSDIIFTPSTKPETGHDVSASPEELIAMGVTTPEEIETLKSCAFSLFRRGQQVALERGLILVDTKYEMGYDSEGVLRVGDEVHTPDSSRYWIAKSYEERFAKGLEPESLDKEFFRLWLRDQGFVDGKPKPVVTDDARVMLSQRYIDLYERMTGEKFVIEQGDVIARMEKNLETYRMPVKA